MLISMFMISESFVPVPQLAGRETCLLGVMADSHLPNRLSSLPAKVFSLFEGADLILHAGDVDQPEYLVELERVAPVLAVRGNPHVLELSDGGRGKLPADLRLEIAGYKVVVNHGGWTGLPSLAADWFMEKLFNPGRQAVNSRIARRLLRQYPEADVIIFGHSHHPFNERRGRSLLFNPGGVCRYGGYPPSVGQLRLNRDLAEAHVFLLDE